MENFIQKNGVSLYLYKGDAATLLAFDLDENLLENFVGFTVRVITKDREYYLNNRLSFKKEILDRNGIDSKSAKSTLYSPIQKYRWVHVPSSEHFIENPYFGDYTYEITPRFLVDNVLLPLDKNLSVKTSIEVSPFKDNDVDVAFTRAFISSLAYQGHFGNNVKLRPEKENLIFDIDSISGQSDRWDKSSHKYLKTNYTFREQHEYLGWQVRDRILEFLDETIKNDNLCLDVFAFDLNEPEISKRILQLAELNRARVILDNSSDHTEPDSFEMKFEQEFVRLNSSANLVRFHFSGLAHSKIFIQRDKNNSMKALKVLTGSTNFTTNGLYVNANHTITFNNESVAELYAALFDKSFNMPKTKEFCADDLSRLDHVFGSDVLSGMTIYFSPHKQEKVDEIFEKISNRIENADSDVLFAIMNDDSKSSILDAVKTQVQSDKIYTYGITDTKSGVQLYKPNCKKGIKVSGIGTNTDLPEPFNDVPKISGHNIHHKFVVVDFKGKNPVVYCGSSNLAYNPEQKNGDNLIEIRDRDIVNAFALEAIRLVDHFHWRNKTKETDDSKKPLILDDCTGDNKWYEAYYNANDLKHVERILFMK